MAKRESPASRSQRAGRNHAAKVTPAMLKAGKANLARGVEANKARGKRAQEARERGEATAGDRWAMLLDGRLTVAELSDKEIEKGRVRNIDGGFTGRGRKMPSHLVTQFMNERLKRERAKIMDLQRVATQSAKDMLTDPDTPPAVRAKLIALLWDRNLGKNPETHRVQIDSGFDKAVREVFVDRGESEQSMQEELDRLIAEAGGTP